MEDWAEEKASFCLATGVAPDQYDRLTRYERDAFVKVHNKNQKRKG